MNENFETNNTQPTHEIITEVPYEVAGAIGSTGIAAAAGERDIITGIPEELRGANESRGEVAVPEREDAPASHRPVIVPVGEGRIVANPERTLGHPANRERLEREANITRSENRGPGR